MSGHTDTYREYQHKLMEVGVALGYQSRRSFRKDAMGDAVWLEKASQKYTSGMLPVVAFKILCSETSKEIRDSITTLQSISPALGVLVLIEEAYAKIGGNLTKYDEKTYPAHIRRIAERLRRGIELSFRVEVWDQKKVDRLYTQYVEEMLPLHGGPGDPT